MDYNDIKLRIKQLLKARSITSKQMAEDIGYTPQGYRGWFLNKTLRVQTVFDIAEYLKVDPRLILFGENSNSIHSAGEDRDHYAPQYIEERISELEEKVQQIESRLESN